jgi:riboflavin synthase
MFSGIVTHIGTVARVERNNDTDWRLFVQSTIDTENVAVGASISCSGCCLTVVDKGGNWFAFDVSGETLSRTVIGSWDAGTRVNLETSLKIGDEIGGHLVSGHVDGLAKIEEIRPEGSSHRLKISVPEHLSLFIAPKGSVALDGISLTVNEVSGNVFGVNIIPHTWMQTTLGEKKEGDRLNLEIDLLARYVARQLGKI